MKRKGFYFAIYWAVSCGIAIFLPSFSYDLGTNAFLSRSFGMLSQSEILSTMDLGSAVDLAKGNLRTILIAVSVTISALVIRPIFVLIGMIMEDRTGQFSFSPSVLFVAAFTLLMLPYHFSHPYALASLRWRILAPFSERSEAACDDTVVPCAADSLSTSAAPPSSSPRPSARPTDLRDRYWQGPIVLQPHPL